MKLKIKSTFLTLAGLGFLANPAMGAVNLTSGDIAVAFYQVVAGVVQSNTYVVDLGSASTFRENFQINVSVSTVSGMSDSNIGADLVQLYGANWYNDSTVRWTVMGGVNSTGSTINGDPLSTTYVSAARGDMSVGTTTPVLLTSPRGTMTTQRISFQTGTNNATQTVGTVDPNANGAIIDKSAINSIEDFLPPVVATTWGISLVSNPVQSFATGTINGTTMEGTLDIWRILNTTTGADRTAGLSSGNAITGTGQYVGTLAIDSSGNLSIIPEPSSLVLGLLGSLGVCFRRRRNA